VGIKKKVTFHSLRHSPAASLRAWFATRLLEDGVDIRYIEELMGHDSVKTTELNTHVRARDGAD